MTIEEPSDAVKAATDWAALSDLADRARELVMTGKMTPAAYAELWAQGLEATKNHPELLEGISRWKPPGA